MKMNAAWAVVIAAFFGMIGGIGQAFLSKPSAPKADKPSTENIGVIPEVADTTVKGIGDWVTLKPNAYYKAETDGFVAVYSGGNNPAAGASILTGPTESDVLTRTRSWGPYDGAVAPVRKGHWWTVKPESSGSVTVQWVPLMR